MTRVALGPLESVPDVHLLRLGHTRWRDFRAPRLPHGNRRRASSLLTGPVRGVDQTGVTGHGTEILGIFLRPRRRAHRKNCGTEGHTAELEGVARPGVLGHRAGVFGIAVTQ